MSRWSRSRRWSTSLLGLGWNSMLPATMPTDATASGQTTPASTAVTSSSDGVPCPRGEQSPEALELLAHGLSNREIAAAMYIGEATAEAHVSRMLAKLGVRDHVQAVVMAREAGVVRHGFSSPGPTAPDGWM